MLRRWLRSGPPIVLAAFILVGCDPVEPTIRVGPDVAVTEGLAQRPPVEAHLAIHPNDPNHLLGAVMTSAVEEDWREMQARQTCSSFVSRDDGQTWDWHEFSPVGCHDPWVTITPDGSAVFTAFVTGGLVVYTSQDAGVSWSETSDTLGQRQDHPLTVADRSSSERSAWLYVLSSQNISVGEEGTARVLFVARSTDAGRTFEPEVRLKPSSLDHFAEVPVVLSDGTLVISYTEVVDSSGEYLPRRRAWVMRSVDSGVTFSDPSFVNDACGPPYRLSWLAADASDGPFRDRLYFACNLLGVSGVVISHSGPDGQEWSNVVQVHAAAADTTILRKVMAVSVNIEGVVGVAWADARNAPADRVCYDIYFAASLDGGESFLPEQRVTESISCPDEAIDGAIGRIFASSGGDYIGMAADLDGRFRLVWPDAREGAFHLRTTWVAVDGKVGASN